MRGIVGAVHSTDVGREELLVREERVRRQPWANWKRGPCVDV